MLTVAFPQGDEQDLFGKVENSHRVTSTQLYKLIKDKERASGTSCLHLGAAVNVCMKLHSQQVRKLKSCSAEWPYVLWPEKPLILSAYLNEPALRCVKKGDEGNNAMMIQDLAGHGWVGPNQITGSEGIKLTNFLFSFPFPRFCLPSTAVTAPKSEPMSRCSSADMLLRR